VCQHSDYRKTLINTKRNKNTACKAKLSVKIKRNTVNTRTKDKYVKVRMIYTYFSWLGAINP